MLGEGGISRLRYIVPMRRDTHRSEVRKSSDGTVTVGEGGGDEEVDKAAENEERRVRVRRREVQVERRERAARLWISQVQIVSTKVVPVIRDT